MYIYIWLDIDLYAYMSICRTSYLDKNMALASENIVPEDGTSMGGCYLFPFDSGNGSVSCVCGNFI